MTRAKESAFQARKTVIEAIRNQRTPEDAAAFIAELTEAMPHELAHAKRRLWDHFPGGLAAHQARSDEPVR